MYLIYDPSQLFEAGFQLSFLCVAAIGLLAVPLLDASSTLYARGLAGITQPSRAPRLPPRAAQFRLELRLLAETASYYIRLPRAWWEHAFALAARVLFYAYELAVISAAIQIGLALPMAIYFHRISLTGISANILVVPLLALVVPLGFLAVLTMWHAPAAIAGGLLGAGERIAEWHTHLEPDWRVLAPPLWLAISFTAALVLLALAMRRSVRWSRGRASGRACALRADLLASVPARGPSRRTRTHGHRRRTRRQPAGLLPRFQTDADRRRRSALVRTPDTLLASTLARTSCRPICGAGPSASIDVVALTHAHDDHAGGLPAIIENFHPAQLWTGATPSSPAWSAVRDKARAEKVKIRRAFERPQLRFRRRAHRRNLTSRRLRSRRQSR